MGTPERAPSNMVPNNKSSQNQPTGNVGATSSVVVSGVDTEEIQRFVTFASAVDPAFWKQLADLKLNVSKLDESARSVHGYYTTNTPRGISPMFHVHAGSLSEQGEPTSEVSDQSVCVSGTLINTNTLENFKMLDKPALLRQVGEKIWNAIVSGAALKQPRLLQQFLLICYADLKKYKFTYWFAFPAFNSNLPTAAANSALPPKVSFPARILQAKPPEPLTSVLTKQQISDLHEHYSSKRKQLSHEPVFFITEASGAFQVREFSQLQQILDLLLKDPTISSTRMFLTFCDPCSHETYPGWPLRNVLTCFAYHYSRALARVAQPSDSRIVFVDVICLRQDDPVGSISAAEQTDAADDLVMSPGASTDLTADPNTHEKQKMVSKSVVLHIKLDLGASLDQQADDIPPPLPELVGWERTPTDNKLMPRHIDLSTMLDPHRLAEQAVDLNLQLMRWRLVPDIQLDRIAATRCLLLGAGTLGCNVARQLLAWGVRNITFVDNSVVSFSNPVRQSLFTYEDCLEGGRPKAQAAADRLQRIFPGAITRGVQLSIPMPGHPVPEALRERVQSDILTLERLINDEHDVVFQLMDTRESRWLPTLIAAAADTEKLVINAALGFDTFLVMRHGVRDPVAKAAEKAENVRPPTDQTHFEPILPSKTSPPKPTPSCKLVAGTKLGCYFCMDVVAPGDSTRDRTLDQQCTVTRPGVSMMAAGLAVELMVSVVQHTLGGRAPACQYSHSDGNNGGGNGLSLFGSSDRADEPSMTVLGIVPHQVRGFLSRWHLMLPVCESFDKCSACSPAVIEEYKKGGQKFLFRAFEEPKYLEEITGLAALHTASEQADIWDLSDDEPDEN